MYRSGLIFVKDKPIFKKSVNMFCAPIRSATNYLQQMNSQTQQTEQKVQKEIKIYEPTEEDQQELETFLNQKKEYEMITKEIVREIQEYFTQFNQQTQYQQENQYLNQNINQMETLFDKLLDINDRRVNFISDNKRIINIFRNKLSGFLRKWDEMNWEIKDCNNKSVDNILRLKEVKRNKDISYERYRTNEINELYEEEKLLFTKNRMDYVPSLL